MGVEGIQKTRRIELLLLCLAGQIHEHLFLQQLFLLLTTLLLCTGTLSV